MGRPTIADEEKRLRELTVIPGPDRTPEQEREYSRLHARKSRRKTTWATLLDKAALCDTEEQFREANWAKLSAGELEKMKALHEECLDQIFFMENGKPGDEFFAEDVECLIEFVQEHPCPHLGYIKRDPDIPANWSSTPYWQKPELLEKLLNESAETADWVRFGLLSGLPDWLVVKFLTDTVGYPQEKAYRVVGWVWDARDYTVKYQ